MMGTNNILKIGDGAQVSACGAKQGAGCFYMGGTGVNSVILEGGINGDAMIQNSEMSCASSTCNGGVFIFKGLDQRIDIN